MARTCKVHNPIDICSEKSINSSSNNDVFTSPADVDRSDFALKISDGQGIKREGTSKDDGNTTQQWQTDIDVTINTDDGLKTIKLSVNKAIANEVKSIFEEIRTNNDTKHFIFKKITGEESTWQSYDKNSYIAGYRQSIVKGTGRNSWHCYGVAVDINAKHNPHSSAHSKSCPICGKLDGVGDDEIHIRTKDHPIVQVFYKHGWSWGGAWTGKPDYMHFCVVNG
jgi:hypothetical protein